jgi:hypothetical protein
VRPVHIAASLAPFVLFALLVALFASPPAPRPADAPPDVFSAGRGMSDVRGLTSTGKPHPAAHYDGSPRTPAEIADHARARDWVMGRLRDLGLSPSIQKGNACGRFTCADVENVVARAFEGAPGPAVVLVAHYDSTPFGPGAADDGAGVATLLETVRALQAGPPPRRPLIVLIDDGEEMGLLGARLFTREHPFAKDAAVVLNFEARGSSGQAAMFETSDGNGWLIGTFARAVDRPVASSVIYTLYKRLPNDTDLSIFKQAGKQGLNFAFADQVYNYHTAHDTERELDPRSLQHMGDQALAVTRALLSAESLPEPAPDSVYFDAFSLALIRYPASLSGPLSVLGAGLAGYELFIGIRRRRTSGGRLAKATALVLGSVVIGAAAGVGLGALFKKIRFPDVGSGPMAMRAMMGDRHAFGPWLAHVAIGAAVSLAFALWLCPRAPGGAGGGKSDAESDGAAAGAGDGKSTAGSPGAAGPDAVALSGGALVVWTVFSLLLGWGAPGASHLFVWPVFGLAAGTAILAARPDPSPWRRTAAVMAAAGPAAFLWLPLMRVLLIMVGATVPPAAIVPVALMGSLVTPVLVVSPPKLRWALPAAAGALALAAAVAALVVKG